MVVQRITTSPTPSSPPPASPLSKDVLYIGSAVPLETSEGLEAIQQPLRLRYPMHDEDNIQGILSTLTVAANGLYLRYHNDPSHVVFFPFSALSLCAAVRCVKTTNTATNEVASRFVSLTQAANDGLVADRPSIFTTITRRTRGRQVLECHGFITVTPKDAMDLVQWTSANDKRYKQTGGAGVNNGDVVGAFTPVNGSFHYTSPATAAMPSGTNSMHDISRHDTSFRGSETASNVDFPVNLVAGEPMVPNASQGFYMETPKEGYFYSTKKAQVKKYSLHKFGKTVTTEEPAPVPPPPATATATVAEAAENGRPGYAGSHVSVPVTHVPPAQPHPPHPHPPPPHMIPPPPPGMVRPVLVHGPPPHPPPPSRVIYPRPRFFSPPPPPAFMRAQPVPVFVPPPPPGLVHVPSPAVVVQNGAAGPRPKSRDRRSRRSSSPSSSSSSRSSSHSSKRGKQRRSQKKLHKTTGVPVVTSSAYTPHHDDSSFLGSRPVTPPTDYDSAPTGRRSRRDEHNMRQSYLRELNGPNRGAMTIWPPGRRQPHGFYVVPINNVYGAPTLPRSKSVPPVPNGKPSKKKIKEKKSKRSSKKSGKGQKGKKNGGGNDADQVIILDHDDPDGVLPYREFPHTFEGGTNQTGGIERSFSKSAAERAFSKSLAAETRSSSHADAFNAYAINHNGVAEGEFPVMY